MKTVSKIITNLVIVFIAFLFSGICAEIFLRFLHPYNDTNPVPIASDPILPYRMIPNTKSFSIDGIQISIDSEGLRDIKPQKSSNNLGSTYLVLGDSTTYGYGVEARDTFTELLQNARNGDGDTSYSFVNAGHSGFNIGDYTNLLLELKNKFKFNFLIIGLMGNDFTTHSLVYEFDDGVGISKDSLLARYNVRPELIKLLRKSALYLTVGNAIKGARYRVTQRSVDTSPDVGTNSREVEQKLDIISQFSISKNVPVLMVYLPTKTELINSEASYPIFNALLAKFATKNKNAHFLDLTKNTTILENIDEIYFKQDWVHPNPNGHKLYCGEILEFLNKLERKSELKNMC